MAEEAAAPVPPAEGEEVPQGEAEAPEELEPVKPPCVDLTSTHLKIDHFDQMHVLGEEGKLSGAPNYRQVKSKFYQLTFYLFFLYSYSQGVRVSSIWYCPAHRGRLQAGFGKDQART